MSRIVYRSVPALVLLVIGLVCMTVEVLSQSGAKNGISSPSTKNGEWPHYTGDLAGTRYSPLDQINADNFNKLEVAWRFKTDNLGTRPEYKLEATPLMVKGMIYTTAGTRRSIIALRAETGELVWVHSEFEGQRAVNSPRQLSGRGLSYWTDGREERILYVTTGYRLIALDAKTGNRIPSFGKDGVVDLKLGVHYGNGQQIDLEKGDAGLHSTPIIARDTVIVGMAMKEGFTVKTHNNVKGQVRAFDVRTGKQLWAFQTIPRPGEFGNDTWHNNSWAVNGNTGVWTQITVDEELGLVYLPVETPTSDFYGGHRPGNNLFAESLVCVDLKPGKRKWHFQVVHHPLWDYDLSSAAILADIKVNGRSIKAVAMPSEQAWVYVFDRVTGEPVWPIEERPVPQGDVPGEWYSQTQPFPTKPPPYARQAVAEDDLIDFTPELRAQAIKVLAQYKNGPIFNPPILSKLGGPLGAMNIAILNGGTNWPGGGYDPETHTIYVPASNASLAPVGMVEPPPGFSDIRYAMGTAGQPFVVREGPGFGSAADFPQKGGGAAPATGGTLVQGLPLVKPPYGTLTGINLDRGEITWQVPHGDTPDVVRNHPLLKGKDIPKTGQNGAVGPVVTKTLVIMGDPQVSTAQGRPRGAMLRAYDKATGKEVGAIYMPAQQSGSPMTYMLNGKQYIIVAVSGGPYSGEYIAYALPPDELPANNLRQ